MGLTLDRVDLDRREVRIDRQLIRVVDAIDQVLGNSCDCLRTVELPHNCFGRSEAYGEWAGL